MAKKKITALPWEAFTQGSFAGWWAIRQKDSEIEVGSGDGGFEKPDAEFIVRAVNSHASLVEALKNLEVSANIVQYCFDRRPEKFGGALTQLQDAAKLARAALAAAGEQS